MTEVHGYHMQDIHHIPRQILHRLHLEFQQSQHSRECLDDRGRNSGALTKYYTTLTFDFSTSKHAAYIALL